MRSHNDQHIIEYKQAQATVRRIMRGGKRAYCDSIKSTTPGGDIWGAVKKKEGVRRE